MASPAEPLAGDGRSARGDMALAHQSKSSRLSEQGIRLTDEEVEAIMEGFDKEDNSEKTWARRLVENYLMHYSWYFPGKNRQDGPSLSKAWHFYEHVTLPRHFTGEESAGGVLRRAEPGEEFETELYQPCAISSSDFVEWGIGVDLYFSSVRMICLMMFIAGCVNIANIYYYSSNAYSGNTYRGGWMLEGSAVCSQTYAAYCEDCTPEQFPGIEYGERIGETGDGRMVVLRNDCNIYLENGIVNWATWVFCMIFMFNLSQYLRARQVRFDEDKLTASDYSVIVMNPPPDAHNPEEWKDFFTQFAEKQVTLVSIHLNNENMQRKLFERRILRDQLERLLPKGTDLDDEDVVRAAVDVHVRERDEEPRGCIGCFLDVTVFWVLHKAEIMLPAETLVDKVHDLTEEIRDLQTKKYDVSKVFVTFETEEGQRAALTALSASGLDIMMNNTHHCPPSTIFHGRVLDVQEPTEPDAIRWMDLSTTRVRNLVASVLTFILTVGLILLAGFLEYMARREYGPYFSAPLVSIFNSIVPLFVKAIMIFESHHTEGSYQTSMYLKITLFRWANTAIVMQVITPFTSTLGINKNDLLPSISAILWFELWLTPALKLLDIVGTLQKHLLAPRALTQDIMNRNFLGTPYNLGERYTDLTKVLFVCFFYSSLFPASFFFGFAILFLQYHSDKFCLLRIWGHAPSLGTNLADFSRRYFFTGALLAFVYASAYAWASFPNDNVCDPVGGTITKTEIPVNVTLFDQDRTVELVVIRQEEPVYYCAQAFRDADGWNFPPRPSMQPDNLRWMTPSQETLVTIFYWSCIAAIVAFFVVLFLGAIINGVTSAFRTNTYQVKGASQQIDFSCNREIVAYYPHYKVKSYSFPFIAADIDDLDRSLLGFTDVSNNLDHHNVIFDVPFPGLRKKNPNPTTDAEAVGGNAPVSFEDVATATENQDERQAQQLERPIFGIVQHYPPAWWNKNKN